MSAAKKLDSTPGLFDYQDVELSDKAYTLFAKKMYDIAGVDLPPTPKNHALLRNRLIKVLRQRDLKTYEEYWTLVNEGSPKVISEFVSALTTNMTSFFRESAHFDFLAKFLPEHFVKNQELRIWCAAASTGQEPYTIAMTVAQGLTDSQLMRTKILATDIDEQVLRKASVGCYEQKEVDTLDPILAKKYFSKVKVTMKRSVEEQFQVNDDLHKMIRFAPFNLMNEKYAFQSKFNVIFCRNVLIYFDEATTKRVISNMVDVLAVGGYLILGHSESGNVKHPNLKPLSRAIYQKI